MCVGECVFMCVSVVDLRLDEDRLTSGSLALLPVFLPAATSINNLLQTASLPMSTDT